MSNDLVDNKFQFKPSSTMLKALFDLQIVLDESNSPQEGRMFTIPTPCGYAAPEGDWEYFGFKIVFV